MNRVGDNNSRIHEGGECGVEGEADDDGCGRGWSGQRNVAIQRSIRQRVRVACKLHASYHIRLQPNVSEGLIVLLPTKKQAGQIFEVRYGCERRRSRVVDDKRQQQCTNIHA